MPPPLDAATARSRLEVAFLVWLQSESRQLRQELRIFEQNLAFIAPVELIVRSCIPILLGVQNLVLQLICSTSVSPRFSLDLSLAVTVLLPGRSCVSSSSW